MAIQLTRAQYKEQYGADPVQLEKSTLDTSPTPVMMTSAEYNARYRPELVREQLGIAGSIKSTIQDIPNDLGSLKGRGTQAIQAGRSIANEARSQVTSSEITPGQGTLKTIGGGAYEGAKAVGDVFLGLMKLPFSPKAEETIKTKAAQFATDVGNNTREEWQQTMADMKASGDPEQEQLAQDIELMVLGYKTDPGVKAEIDGIGGLAAAASEFFGLGKSSKVVKPSLNYSKNLAEQAGTRIAKTATDLDISLNSRALRKAESDIFDIENSYATTRKVIDASTDSGVSSRKRIATSGVLEGAVDENGVIRTTIKDGAVDQYKAITIDGTEDIVRKTLVAENASVNIDEVRNILKTKIASTGLEGSDLVSALNGVERELEGLRLRADEFGNVPLSKVHDAKINATSNINYLTDSTPTITFRKAKARAYKEIVENKSKADVKNINSELAKFYEDIDRLRRLDGKRVKGGRLGKHFSQLGGQLVGGAAGSVAGGPGAAAGSFLGGEIAARLQQRAMQRTFHGRRNVPEKNPVLERAKQSIGSGELNLKQPDVAVGVPKGFKQTAETRSLERQIKKNVADQAKAIKKGDFALVAALKDVYQALVKRLKEVIDTTPTIKGDSSEMFESPSLVERAKTALKDQRGAINPNRKAERLRESSAKITKLSTQGKQNIADFLAQVDGTIKLPSDEWRQLQADILDFANKTNMNSKGGSNKAIASELAELYGSEVRFYSQSPDK